MEFRVFQPEGRNVTQKCTEKRKTESTPAQQKICNAFKSVTAVWKTMPKLIRKSWKNIADAKAISKFNEFVSANASNQANGNV